MKDLNEALAAMRGDDPLARTAAWQAAAKLGAPAVKPLARIAQAEPPEVARAARRALAGIVRASGAPGASEERAAVVRELLDLLGDDQPAALRRDVLWLLSETGGDDAVARIAALLRDGTLREDARMALERIPGGKSLAALREALASAPADFQPGIAQALRARGEKVDPVKFPCMKLVPTR